MQARCRAWPEIKDRTTYYRDLISFHFHFWSSKVLESDDAGQTCTIDHISGVGENVDRQANVPYLYRAEDMRINSN